jgi:hypothetical protein
MSAQAQTASKFQQLKDHIPVVSKVVAIIILVLNIFIPGLGTALMSCIGGKFIVEHLVIGLIQFILAPCVIGWIWSILWGILVVLRSSG